MLYGSTCFGELPLSTIRPQLPNGEDFDWDLIIDQLFDNDLCIQQELYRNIFINQETLFPIILDSLKADDLEIQQIKEFTLKIDKNNRFGV